MKPSNMFQISFQETHKTKYQMKAMLRFYFSEVPKLLRTKYNESNSILANPYICTISQPPAALRKSSSPFSRNIYKNTIEYTICASLTSSRPRHHETTFVEYNKIEPLRHQFSWNRYETQCKIELNWHVHRNDQTNMS